MSDFASKEAVVSYTISKNNVSQLRMEIEHHDEAIGILREIINAPYSVEKYTLPFKAADKIIAVLTNFANDKNVSKEEEVIIHFYKSIIIQIYKLPIENYRQNSVISIINTLEYVRDGLASYANNMYKNSATA